ncbi:hypothetical protein TPCCA_0766a [Treponema paraluiscuniculi Cuniculi A]|uniref:Uncharacterized protein n=2 Tax=Treponema paraluiscuniculi TaxID=53435 RepID=F7XTI3_TREPU|nr:hypothetical protein TPCCA_0766a [Treponema paraluiscuniculi Cuniculi A]WKC72624.1 hypothetical protein TPLL2_0766a [Treponema paraluiscuniculi]
MCIGTTPPEKAGARLPRGGGLRPATPAERGLVFFLRACYAARQSPRKKELL